MLGKIFKSEHSDNNRQPTASISTRPNQQKGATDDVRNTIPSKKYKFHILKQVNQSPANPSNENDVYTPVFVDKQGEIVQQIGKFQQKSNRMAQFFNNYNEQSEKHSQVPSNNDLNVDQLHPMILSDSNVNLKSIDRLSMMRIRNYVSDLKQIHMDLSEYVEDQKGIIEYFKQKIFLQSEEFFSKYNNKVGNQNQELIKHIHNLERVIEQKNEEKEQLNQGLNEQKIQLEKEQEDNRILRTANLINTKSNGFNTSQNQKDDRSCANCRQLQEKISAQQSQTEQRQSYISNLVVENQAIQEQIFDLEQRIVGIDLEVQKRLKERSKNISERELRARLQKMQTSSNDEDRNNCIEQLKEQIDILQQKCKRYEELDVKENELLQKIKITQETELNLHYKELSLKEKAAKMEEHKQIYSNKEHSILMAEESLSKKKEELRSKEAELSQWEAELTKKASNMRNINKDNTLSQQFADDEHYGNSVDELKQSKEMSQKSFGVSNNYHQIKLRGEVFNNTSPDFLRQSLKMNRKNDLKNQEPNRNQRRIEGQGRDKLRGQQRQPYSILVNRDDRIREIQGAEKNNPAPVYPVINPNQKGTDITINKKIDVQSHYRELRQESPYANLREQNRLIKAVQRTPYQFELPSSHQRESSKNSRGSTSKGIKQRLQHQLSRSGVSMRESTQLTGIGSKLQRLRAQIKKQIDSIK